MSDMSMLDSAKRWARGITRDTVALWLAARDPRVPWYAKAAAGAVAAYALSPVDLIPDFIPVIGYLDDLLIVPLGIMLAFGVLSGVLGVGLLAFSTTYGLRVAWRSFRGDR